MNASPSEPHSINEDEFQALARQIRLITLLEVAELAGLSPIALPRLHVLAYLSNVLASLWDLPPMSGSLLKNEDAPYYPALQRDLDRLVGQGVVTATNLRYAQSPSGQWRLEADYVLQHSFADPITRAIRKWEGDQLVPYLEELAYAVSALTDEQLSAVTRKDATYSDPLVGAGSVIDFGEWRTQNRTVSAARRLGELLDVSENATAGQMIHLYIRHLKRRLAAGA